MKNFLLIISVLLSSMIFAQGHETFDNLGHTGNSYQDGSFVGQDGIEWTYGQSRGDIELDGAAITLGRNRTEDMYLESAALTNGVGTLEFSYSQAFSNPVNLEVLVDGVLVYTATSDNEQGVIKSSGVITVEAEAGAVIKFNNPDGAQVTLDDIIWTAFDGGGNPAPVIEYEFDNGVWTPQDPSGVATTADDIYVYNGEADLTLDTSANNIMIDDGATLNIHGVLTLAGDLDNSWGGSLVFKSTATSNGELGSVGGTIDGDATVERYMSANRSYRMVTSAVTTSTSINANWQEGVNNTATDFQNNQDPNPGYGTHITGSTTGLNGFDATITGNPSIFTVDLANQEFMALDNTNANILDAGEPYL